MAVGDVVLCRVIEEPCQHSVVIEGLCTDCGLIVVKGGTDNAVASFFENCYTRKLGFLSPSTDFSISAEVLIEALQGVHWQNLDCLYQLATPRCRCLIRPPSSWSSRKCLFY